jgi:hypothetical protein
MSLSFTFLLSLSAGDVFRARLILALAERSALQPDHGIAENHGADDFPLEEAV